MNKRGKRKNKISRKGLSTIIMTMIIIFVSLVAVGIFWAVINNLLKGGSENIGLGKITFSAEISQVHVDNSSNNVSFKITRKVGTGDIVGMKFIFENSAGQEIATELFELSELASRKFLIHLTMDVSSITKISVVPLFKSSKAEYTVGNVVAIYNLKGTESATYICGNGISEPGEFCDSPDLDGATCQSLGFMSGTLDCSASCSYNTSQCVSVPSSCDLCSDCEEGVLDTCSYSECHSCNGTCYYRGDIWFAEDCVSVTEACSSLVTQCLEYSTYECNNDPCNLNCELNGTVCIESIPEAPPVNITPILWYKFDGNLADSSGISPALDGSWVGSAGTFVAGVDGQAVNLAGTDGISSSDNSRLNSMDKLTVSVYAKKNDAAQGGYLIFKHIEYTLIIGVNSVYGSVYTSAGPVERAFSATANINDTNWHQYTLTYDGVRVKLFVDGAELTSVLAGGSVYTGSGLGLYVGKDPWGATFNGQIDDVRIYNDSVTPPECSPGSTKLCDKQLGVCAGSTQTCNSGQHWPGCTTSTYFAYDSHYLAIEGPLGNPSCSDGYDNDCDGNTDGTDTGCMNLYTLNTRTGEDALFDAVKVMNYYGAGFANWSYIYDWNFGDGIYNDPTSILDDGGIAMLHNYPAEGSREATLTVHKADLVYYEWGPDLVGYGDLVGEYPIIVNTVGEYSTAFELWHAPYHARTGQWIYARLDNDPAVDYDNDVTLDISSYPAYRMTAVLTRDSGGYTETLFNADRSLNTEERFLLNNSKLSSGNYTLSVKILSSLGGSVVQQIDEHFEKPYNGIPTVGIDENNNFRLNGELYFPVTPFGLDYDYVPEWANKYINTLEVQGWDAEFFTPQTFAEHLDIASANNLKSIGPELWWGNNYDGKQRMHFERNSNISRVIEYIQYNKNHPALFGWLWDDEPNMGGQTGFIVPEALATWSYLTFKYDPQHPVFMQLLGADYLPYYWDMDYRLGFDYMYNSEYFGKKTSLADAVGFDIYPIEYQYELNLVNPTRGPIDMWLTAIENLNTANYGLSPLAVFIETQDLRAEDLTNPPGCTPYDHATNTTGTCYAQIMNWPWTKGPSPEEVLMESWAAVIHGVKHISWFHYHTPTPPENFAAMAKFYSHITQLTKIVLAPNTTRTLTDNSNVRGNRVDTMIKENSSDIYIFAVRVTEPDTEWDETFEPVSVSTTFNVGGTTSGTISVFNESRTLTLSGGQFTDTFNRYAYHIYRIPKS
ncbi:MAG: LamG domain-containing protein [Candidatus Nanoarchaeia archaeon]|nr:LamG domain-containing protein [Candidatus Nanoarchaeia archaeon]MDD5357852.1 LamG domain-containing protein [Candidatus Nanoarchaeia archaeon]MDD5588771.1 LamG domain-containing protein [Candidatus Nanoarchaeia archaeon]